MASMPVLPSARRESEMIRSGLPPFCRQAGERGLARGRGLDLAAPALQDAAHAVEDEGVVVDHDHPLAARRIGDGRRWDRHLRRARAAARPTAPIPRSASRGRGASPARPGGRAGGRAGRRWPGRGRARRWRSAAGARQLVELAEDALALVLRNAGSAVAHVDAQLLAAAAAADHHAAPLRVAHRVGHEVEQDPLEQDRIARHPGVAADHAQAQPLLARGIGEGGLDALEQPGDGELGQVRSRGCRPRAWSCRAAPRTARSWSRPRRRCGRPAGCARPGRIRPAAGRRTGSGHAAAGAGRGSPRRESATCTCWRSPAAGSSPGSPRAREQDFPRPAQLREAHKSTIAIRRMQVTMVVATKCANSVAGGCNPVSLGTTISRATTSATDRRPKSTERRTRSVPKNRSVSPAATRKYICMPVSVPSRQIRMNRKA